MRKNKKTPYCCINCKHEQSVTNEEILSMAIASGAGVIFCPMCNGIMTPTRTQKTRTSANCRR